MSPNSNHLFLTAEYALGLLNLQETAQAHALLGADYQAVVSALKWEDRFLALADHLPPIEAPADLLLQIQTALGHDTTMPLRPSAMPQASTASTPAPESKPQKAARHSTKPSKPDPSNASAIKASPAPAPKPTRKGFWSHLWTWRAIAVLLALALGATILLPRQDPSAAAPSESDEARKAASQVPVAAKSDKERAAILQAPGQTSTPGWVITVDDQNNLILTPRVDIEVPEDRAVYLWTRGDNESPRLLAGLSPNMPATVPAAVAGQMPPGQIFEITQEVREPAPPTAPKGPILFIGRLVALN